MSQGPTKELLAIVLSADSAEGEVPRPAPGLMNWVKFIMTVTQAAPSAAPLQVNPREFRTEPPA